MNAKDPSASGCECNEYANETFRLGFMEES